MARRSRDIASSAAETARLEAKVEALEALLAEQERQIRDQAGALERSLEELRLLQSLYEDIGPAQDFFAALDVAVRRVCKTTGWVYGEVWIPDAAGGRLEMASLGYCTTEALKRFRDVSARMSFAVGEGLPGEAWRRKRPVWRRDAFTRFDDAGRSMAAREAGLQAGLGVPILGGGGLLAVLTFFMFEPREQDDRQVSLISAVAGGLGEILQRKRAEEALRQSEDRFRSVAETATDAIVLADAQGRILFFNRAARGTFGYETEDVIGKPLTTLMPARFHERHRAGWARYQQTGETRVIGRVVELDGLRKDGTEFPIELSLATWAHGGAPLFAGIIRDVTERRRAREDLRQRAEALERSNTELGQFAYAASHDLQEPLRVVASFAQLLERRAGPALDGDSRGYLGYIVEGARRMQRLIDDLLTYSQEGSRELVLAPVAVEPLLQQALENLRGAIEESGAAVTNEGLPVVRGDARRLGGLFQNLVGNAIKFRGAEPPRVRISAKREGAMWEFAVRDNGIGIAPEHHLRIFHLFARLHGPEQYPGTGIGLSICQRIVERHGGRIWVESEAGKGATIRFTLPAPAEEPA